MNTSIGKSFGKIHESFLAGEEAAHNAVEGLGMSPDLFFVTATPDYEPEDVLRGISSVTDVPMIGCVSEGTIVSEGLRSEGLVAVMAFKLPQGRCFIEYEHGEKSDSRTLGKAFAEKIVSRLRALDPQQVEPVLLVLMSKELDSYHISAGIAETLGSLMSVVGQNCHHDFGQVFVNDAVKSGTVAGLLLCPDTPVGIDLAHGWKPSGKSVVATRSKDYQIFELGTKSAFTRYQEVWHDSFPNIEGKSFQQIQQIFRDFAAYHTLGLAQVTGEYLIRDPWAVLEDGSLLCGGGIPEHAVLHFMQGEPQTVARAVGTATQRALDKIQGHALEGVLFFDCVTRNMLPNYNIQTDLEQIQEGLPQEVPLLGLLSRGEIANTGRGLTLYHNKTLVLAVFSR